MASNKQSSFSSDELCCSEPSLDELLAEPIVQLFMKRDQVNPFDIRAKLTEVIGSHMVANA